MNNSFDLKVPFKGSSYTKKKKPSKRAFDIFFSLNILFFLSPLFVIISFLILLTSRGSIFFSQERVSMNGKIFKCFKFRTMYKNADQSLKELLENSPEMKKEWYSLWKLKNDPRVTFVGKFLRRTSLDELPQFLNVLKGDLSVVGPRPVTLTEITLYFGQRASKILSIRPGITGLWQVSGRNNVSFETRLEMEENYIDNHGFFFDLFLICKTIPVILFGKGAY